MSRRMLDLEHEISMHRVQSDFYIKQSAKLRNTTFIFLAFLIYMILIASKTAESTFDRMPIHSKQNFTLQNRTDDLLQPELLIIPKDPQEELLVEPLVPLDSLMPQQNENLTHQVLTQPDPSDSKISITLTKKESKKTPMSYGYVTHCIQQQLFQLFELNRTLVNEVKYLVNEEEPPLLRQSMVFSEKEKSQLKAIGEYLISNKTVLDILLRRVQSNTRLETYPIIILNELKNDVKKCEILFQEEFSAFIKSHYLKEFQRAETLVLLGQSKFTPVHLRYRLDSVLYEQCFKEFNHSMKYLLQKVNQKMM